MRRFTLIILGAAAIGGVTAVAAPDGADLSASMTQLKARADADQSRIDEVEKHVTVLKATAVRKKDVIKLNCINDKLVQLKALMRIAGGQQVDLNSAIQGNQDSAAAGVLGQLDASTHQIVELGAQADQCMGEVDLIKQESSVEVTHPDIPDQPSTVPPLIITVEPPAYASPFN